MDQLPDAGTVNVGDTPHIENDVLDALLEKFVDRVPAGNRPLALLSGGHPGQGLLVTNHLP